jgi:hypothetical protein
MLKASVATTTSPTRTPVRICLPQPE